MSAGESPAVATWYSSGWKRWWLRRSTSVTCSGARRSARGGEPAESSADDDDVRLVVSHGQLLSVGDNGLIMYVVLARAASFPCDQMSTSA